MTWLKFVIFFGIVAGMLVFGRWYADKKAPNLNTTNNMQSSEEQLRVEDIVVGTGAEAKRGDVLEVHYLGTLPNGAKFDSSYDRGEPFQFILGAGEVISGWDMGVVGMRVGGKRSLIIPSVLGYGSQGMGPIPPNSTLNFTIELLNIKTNP